MSVNHVLLATLATVSAHLLTLAQPVALSQEIRGDRAFAQVVTIEVSDVADAIQRAEIERRVSKLTAEVVGHEWITRFGTGRGGVFVARVAPIKDVNAFRHVQEIGWWSPPVVGR